MAELSSSFYVDPQDLAPLAALAEEEGFESIDDLIFEVALRSVQPGICRVCGFTASRMEPDQREGWCEECETPTVRSVAVLAGLN